MRINVYSQELTKNYEIIEKQSDNGVVYYGVRLYLASPEVLHDTKDDDDRSAITFFHSRGGNPHKVRGCRAPTPKPASILKPKPEVRRHLCLPKHKPGPICAGFRG